MIHIIKAKEPPTVLIECANCGNICGHYVPGVDHFRLRCPVCKVSFTAPWITRKKEEEPSTEMTEE